MFFGAFQIITSFLNMIRVQFSPLRKEIMVEKLQGKILGKVQKSNLSNEKSKVGKNDILGMIVVTTKSWNDNKIKP